MTMRAFVRINDSKSYSRSALQSNIKSISEATWQKIHGMTVMHAKKIGIEKGKTVRMDATVVESNISSPIDSQLMVDCLRVISRIAFWMNEQGLEIKLAYKHKKAKAASLAILNAKNEEARLEFYLPLILGSGEVFMQLTQIISTLKKSENLPKARDKLVKTLNNLTGLFEGIIAQTIARVVDGEKEDSCDKIISIFEEHSDI